jgi:hypothetical protein
MSLYVDFIHYYLSVTREIPNLWFLRLHTNSIDILPRASGSVPDT